MEIVQLIQVSSCIRQFVLCMLPQALVLKHVCASQVHVGPLVLS